MRTLVIVIVLVVQLSATATAQNEESPSIQTLTAYLKKQRQSPEDYVAKKFRTHDIIFIGEAHWIKHDPLFIQGLIPHLYKAGVYDLGIEFGSYELQDTVDRLLTAEFYDEDLARWLMFKNMVDWGYIEYIDLYRAAWRFNRSLPKSATHFRIINLGYTPNWRFRQEEMTPELWKKVWHKGDPDEYMAKVIISEFVEKGRKALIYMGKHHAFTRYRQPVYDVPTNTLYRFEDRRTGNLVYARVPARVFNIVLHSPFPALSGYGQRVLPVHGVIDQLMRGVKDTRVGFDVVGSPFGNLRDSRTFYSYGYADFKLSDFCDGYIFQRPLAKYEAVTVDEKFVTESNLAEAISRLASPNARASYRRPEDFLKSMRDPLKVVESYAAVK